MSKSLDLLHPEVKKAALTLIDLASKKGLRLIVTQTLRTAEEQAALYAQGREPLEWVNNKRALAGLPPITQLENKGRVTKARTSADSFHGYGLAFDIAITDKSGRKIIWDSSSDWNADGIDDWAQVGRLAEQIPGLEWGGNFTSIVDMPHYQMRFGLTIADLKAGKRPKGYNGPETV